jgi:hypothetical protein
MNKGKRRDCDPRNGNVRAADIKFERECLSMRLTECVNQEKGF